MPKWLCGLFGHGRLKIVERLSETSAKVACLRCNALFAAKCAGEYAGAMIPWDYDCEAHDWPLRATPARGKGRSRNGV